MKYTKQPILAISLKMSPDPNDYFDKTLFKSPAGLEPPWKEFGVLKNWKYAGEGLVVGKYVWANLIYRLIVEAILK